MHCGPLHLRRQSTDEDSLDERLSKFAGAILSPAQGSMPDGLVGPDGQPSTRRFAVYRNNVVVGLCESLKANFPVVRRLVGDEFFMAMALAYVLDNPPDSPVMIQYGFTFADFIGSFAPASGLPYLRDVASLERAWMESYYAAEALPLDANDLAQIEPDALAETCFTLHPSARIVRSCYPIRSIWLANIGGGTPPSIESIERHEDVFIVRPAADVNVQLLLSGEATFLSALESGLPVIEALHAALATDPGFGLADSLTAVFEAGAVVGFRLPAITNERIDPELI